ncbi:MAG: hypothetical protein ACREXK_01370 [Gammaproteobacteria bacterium]
MPGAFAKKQEELEKRLREQELAVLVWGPGVGGGEHHEKRRKIRQALEEHFSKSEVRFSEELKQLVPGADDIGIGEQEEYQLALSDACVVLDMSAGPAAEIAYFARSPLKHKLIVFTHDRHKGSESFPAQLREGLEHHFYSDAEYASCSLVERVCDRMRHAALGKLLGVSPL